jgi:predicted flap endonuclease-1-like 5' DNA nuclease
VSDDRPGDPVPRQTLAMRLAARSGQRELRAARLARLRGAAGPDGGGDDDAAALEDFLQALAGATRPGPAAPRPLPTGEVLPFQAAPAPAPACDLDRLPGAGPGLVLALRRAGLPRLADVAGLAPQELAVRLGPIGRLIPAETWIAAARAAAAPAARPLPPDPAP